MKMAGQTVFLGRVFFKVPGFAGGSKEKSLEHLQKSKELGPEDALTRVYLAETLLDMKKVDEAKAELDFVLAMEDDSRWALDIASSKAEATALLKDKKFKKIGISLLSSAAIRSSC